MNARLPTAIFIIAFVAAAIGYHIRLRHTITMAAAEQAAALRRASALTDNECSLKQEIESTRAKRESLLKSVSVSGTLLRTAAARAPNYSRSPSGAELSQVSVQMSDIANRPNLRQMRVRAFVSEQRLKFAAFFHELAIAPEKLERFDEIQAEYQEGALDLASTARAQGITNSRDLIPLRGQVVDTCDAHLRMVFISEAVSE